MSTPGQRQSANSSLEVNMYIASMEVLLKVYKQCEVLHHLAKENYEHLPTVAERQS